jgi:hypothetical protein
MDLAVVVTQLKGLHAGVEGRCNECTESWPCPEYRIADDWERQRADLTRAFRNRTGRELFELRKYACTMCSTKDTGLVCVDCIAEAEGEGEEDGSTND